VPARIRIERPAGYWADRERVYEIVIDGQPAGSVRAGECGDFAVSPGEHEVQARNDWSRSVPVKVSARDELRLVCRPSLSNADLWRPWRVLRAVRGGRLIELDVSS